MKIEPLESRIAPAIIFAVEANTNQLVTFDHNAPGTIRSDVPITGLKFGDVVVGIDFRAETGELYALGIVDNGPTRAGHIYKLNTETGVATQVGAAPFSTTLEDTGSYSFDVDPLNDLIRIVNGLDGNYRVYPDTGALFKKDMNVDDPDITELVSGVAYTARTGSNTTTLYGINYLTDQLVLIGGLNGNPSPDTGTITPIAKITSNGQNLEFDIEAGFDIAALIGGPEQGWFLGTKSNVTSIYTLDLATGAAVNFGAVGDGTRDFSGMAVSRLGPAPAISTDGKSATWTDIDGDLVTLKVSKGGLTPAAFTMFLGQTGTALSKLTLLDEVFAGTDITLTAKPGTNGGDGTVNVGTIDATGRDLGKVNIPGDLSAILAGDANLVTPGLKALNVLSIGKQGGQLVRPDDNATSGINGTLGSLKIAGDLSGSLFATKILSATIGGDIITVEPFTVANIIATTLGKLTVKGSVGPGETLAIFAGNASSITIGGDLIGGSSPESGTIVVDSAIPTKITIGGSLIGGTGDKSGSVLSEGSGALNLIIKGSVIRKSGNIGSANIVVEGASTIIAIGGSVRGGEIMSSVGAGFRFVKSLTIGGNLESDPTTTSGIDVGRIGKLIIKGSVIGQATSPVIIAALGSNGPANQAAALAIGSIKIGGSVTYGSIGAGYGLGLSLAGDVAIGTIKIGGSLIASSIVAGVDPVNGKFGDADDIMQATFNTPKIVSKIASIAVGGQIYGTAGGPADTFGIQAQEIGTITVGKTKLTLNAVKNLLIGFTNDVRVRQL